MDINTRAPMSGRVISEDGQVYNIVDLAAGTVAPVPGLKADINSYAPHTGRYIAEDGSIYNIVDLLISVTNGSGSGTGGGSSLAWE